MAAIPEGFPDVPRFSSLLNYLQLCSVGVELQSETLQAIIEKTAADEWRLQDDNSRVFTALQVVIAMRSMIAVDEPQRNLDRLFIYIEPVDKIKIKKEMVAQGPEEIERGSGMKLAEIDLTGDEAIETATFDRGLAVPQQVHCV